MSGPKRIEAGAGDTATGLGVAKASGPATSSTALVVRPQTKNDEPIGATALSLQASKGLTTLEAEPDNFRNGKSVAVLDDELRSGKFGFIRWDEFVGGIVVDAGRRRRVLDRVLVQEIMIQLDRSGFRGVNRTTLIQCLEYVAKTQRFNSMQEWLDLLPVWDGVRRVEQFFQRYFNAKGGKYEMAVARYFWTAMVARVVYPGCKADMVPVLVGAEGCGKSTSLQTLAPSIALWTDVRLSDRQEKLTRKIWGRFLIEWQDLRGIKGRVDADEVRAFILNQFLERESEFTEGTDRVDRCCVLVGTSRRDDFARDVAGNRIFLPVRVEAADLALLSADKMQLWAEALIMMSNRVSSGLPPVDFEEAEQLADEVLEEFEPEGRWTNDPSLCRYLQDRPEKFSTDDALGKVDLRQTGTGSLQKDRSEMCRSLKQNGYYQKPTHVPGKRSKPRRWHSALSKKRTFRELFPGIVDWDLVE